MNSFEEVYETMLGLREEGFQAPGVESAFEEDSLCTAEYERMRSAYARVCLRLGAEEDQDLETMVTAMEAIQKELCRRIYQLR